MKTRSSSHRNGLAPASTPLGTSTQSQPEGLSSSQITPSSSGTGSFSTKIKPSGKPKRTAKSTSTTLERRGYYGTWKTFMQNVESLLAPTAAGKGYSTNGVDGHNPLYEFVEETSGGCGHALGEIIYKARRYSRKGDPVDIEKIAAWAFLIWRHHRYDWYADAPPQRPSNQQR